jgi:hypothetical protein
VVQYPFLNLESKALKGLNIIDPGEVEESFIYAIGHHPGSAGLKNLHEPEGHVAIQLVVRRANDQSMFLDVFPEFKDRLTHFNAQCLGLF